MAVSKGHGVGGSVMCAWLVDWIMSTRPHAQGTVTANTFTQLETKTWATIQHWTKLCLTASWFEIGGSRMYHRDGTPVLRDFTVMGADVAWEIHDKTGAVKPVAATASVSLNDAGQIEITTT